MSRYRYRKLKSRKVKNKKPRKLEWMLRLQLGQNYISLSFLLHVAVVVGYLFFGPPGLIVLPLACFYLAALQLYSGVGLEFFHWRKTAYYDRLIFRRSEPTLIAKYRKKKETSLFFRSVVLCLAGGVLFTLLWVVLMFFFRK